MLFKFSMFFLDLGLIDQSKEGKPHCVKFSHHYYLIIFLFYLKAFALYILIFSYWLHKGPYLSS
jgi:hypothetical protein